MNYDWLGYDVIEKSKYPNLLAEIKESGYSICTVSDHMGCNPHVSEDDPGTWNKLLGRQGITLEESIGLVRLFNVSYEYLFAPHLEKVGAVPIAHFRWYKQIQRKKAESQLYMTQQELYIHLIPEIAKIAVDCRKRDDIQYAEWKRETLANTPDCVKNFMEKVIVVLDDVRNTKGAE